ncbi:imidazoleglycerol-phosphate dehydratase HisB [Anaerofustis sp.]|uniref:imidazoleglycerol-phosphate dehydratase HisB n=1 Tax=Anaerofustis sp. TaxID=1872517 RepID=UPI0025BE2D05|nr:imidazoleglycerol-phosphate dehydratase HisB [Anaerofustis sp.]
MRSSYEHRVTKETDIEINFNIDGNGNVYADTGVGFFNHMITLLSSHSKFDIDIKAKGDFEVDNHHTIEDIGIVLGKCFRESIGDKRGINRYSTFFVPMDEVLARVCVDISGRGYLVYENPFTVERIGDFETEILEDFLYAFCINAGINLNIKVLDKGNNHHMCEAIFKALARALKEAATITGEDVPSSKGVL